MGGASSAGAKKGEALSITVHRPVQTKKPERRLRNYSKKAVSGLFTAETGKKHGDQDKKSAVKKNLDLNSPQRQISHLTFPLAFKAAFGQQ